MENKDRLDSLINAYEHTADTAFDRSTLSFLKELREHKKAEEQGLLLKLPCKVGDVVYSLTPFCEICEEYLDNEYACECCCRGNFVTETKFDYEMIRMFGKTVFLTKEEAEQAEKALKEMEGIDETYII